MSVSTFDPNDGCADGCPLSLCTFTEMDRMRRSAWDPTTLIMGFLPAGLRRHSPQRGGAFPSFRVPDASTTAEQNGASDPQPKPLQQRAHAERDGGGGGHTTATRGGVGAGET